MSFNKANYFFAISRMADNTNNSFQGKQFSERCYLYAYEINMVAGFPSKVYYVNYVVLLILNILLTVMTIFLNSVTILAYKKSTQLQSKTSYFLIMLLSVSDLLVGLFGNTSYILVLITTIIGYPRCQIYIVFELITYYTCAESFSTLFCLNVERYLSILHPFYHRTKVTKSKLLKIIIALWFSAITLRLSYLVFGAAVDHITSSIIVATTFSTLYIYAAILIKVLRRQRIQESRKIEIQNAAARIGEERTGQTTAQQNTKMAKSCGIVVAMTYICYIPFAVTRSLPNNYIINFLSLWSATLALSLSSFNSLIFFWNNPVFKREAKKLFIQEHRVL